MDPAPEPTYRDQLFKSTCVILDTVKSLGPNDVIDVVFLEEGILALHDTLMRSRCVPSSTLDPFYLVCLDVCQALTNQITSNMDVSDLKDVLVNGYPLCQLPRVLLTLFHALGTFLNFICLRGKLGADTRKRCLTCVACAIRDLQRHKTHLEALGNSLLILLQRHVITSCLLMFLHRMCEVGVYTSGGTYCECVSYGSNRKLSRHDDVFVLRVGKDALEHFAILGESLLEEIRQRAVLAEDKILEDISKRYVDLERRFRMALNDLARDQALVSREIITRGYRLEFRGVTYTKLRRLGLLEK